MNKEQIFSVWAPDDGRWSRWAKPVLFAHMESASGEIFTAGVTPDLSGVPDSAIHDTALVVDLPGAEGVLAGVALAQRGYRPVPLYNAIPISIGGVAVQPLLHRVTAAVQVLPIVRALQDHTVQLAGLKLAAEAPPAFLLDSNRGGAGRKMLPDEFDNRSVSFTTDFPSAIFLAAHGIRRVILIQKLRDDPLPDLAHSFCRWQEGGLTLERMRLDLPGAPESFRVTKPSWYGVMFQRALASFGLRRSGTGGFGAWVPDSPSVG